MFFEIMVQPAFHATTQPSINLIEADTGPSGASGQARA